MWLFGLQESVSGKDRLVLGSRVSVDSICGMEVVLRLEDQDRLCS